SLRTETVIDESTASMAYPSEYLRTVLNRSGFVPADVDLDQVPGRIRRSARLAGSRALKNNRPTPELRWHNQSARTSPLRHPLWTAVLPVIRRGKLTTTRSPQKSKPAEK